MRLTNFTVPGPLRTDQLKAEIQAAFPATFLKDCGYNPTELGVVDGNFTEANRTALQAVFTAHVPNPNWGMPDGGDHQHPVTPGHPDAEAHEGIGVATTVTTNDAIAAAVDFHVQTPGGSHPVVPHNHDGTYAPAHTHPYSLDTHTHPGGGGGGVEVGIIAMWSGTLATIPTGWSLCDGLNGTPDLRDKFIMGAAAGQNPGATGGATTHTHSDHTGVINHTHPVTDPGHSHITQRYPTATGSLTGFTADTSMNGTPAANTLPTASGATGVTTNNPAGGVAAQAHSADSNLPPFYALAYIMKTSSGVSVVSEPVPAVVVASADMPQSIKDAADFVCDGTADQVEINSALLLAAPLQSRNANMPAGAQQRGRVALTGGRFNIAAPVTLYTGTHLQGAGFLTELRTAAGMGATQGILELQNNRSHLVEASNLSLIGPNGTSGHGIHFVGDTTTQADDGYISSSPDPQCSVHDIWFDITGTGRHGAWFQNDMRGTMVDNVNGRADGNCIWFDASPDSFITNCHVHSAGVGFAGFYMNGANLRAANCKAYFCDGWGFYLPNGRNELVGCEAQDSEIGFEFAGPDHIASGITADVCQTDAILVNASHLVLQFHALYRTGARYASATNGIRFASAGLTDLNIMGTIKKANGFPTNGVAGTLPTSANRNFIRVSDHVSMTAVG